MLWEWILSGFVGAVVAYLIFAVALVFQGFALEDDGARARVMSWVGPWRTIQRVDIRSDADLLRGAWKQVFGPHVHEDRVPACEDLVRWLQEDMHAEVSEEIVLVTRRRFRPRYTGMLYATLYPKYIGAQEQREEDDRCFVWHAASAFDDAEKDREVLDRLWKKLREFVEERSDAYKMPTPACEYYFEAIAHDQPPDAGTWPGERERRERYLSFLCSEAVGARIVGLDYRIPDWEEREDSPGTLLYVRRPRVAEDALPRDKVLDFVYGTVHVWGWTYGDDVLTLGQLEKVVGYFNEVREKVASNAEPMLSLQAFPPPAPGYAVAPSAAATQP